jgi:hypothetical protein
MELAETCFCRQFVQTNGQPNDPVGLWVHGLVNKPRAGQSFNLRILAHRTLTAFGLTLLRSVEVTINAAWKAALSVRLGRAAKQQKAPTFAPGLGTPLEAGAREEPAPAVEQFSF